MQPIRNAGAVVALIVLLLTVSGELIWRVRDYYSNEWATAVYEDYDFQIEHPATWEVDLHGETGRRGARDIRMVIYKPKSWLFGGSDVWLNVIQHPATNPSLDDVVNLGTERLNISSPQEIEQGSGNYQLIWHREEALNNISIARRRFSMYGSIVSTVEEIYIPRDDDMIIIRLRVAEVEFDELYDDLDRIISSFQTIP